MNDSSLSAIRSTTAASNLGRLPFGEVIGRLVAAGVESCHVDHRSGRAPCFLPDGATVDFGVERAAHGGADAFDGDAVRTAVRGARQGQVTHPEFKRLPQRAGCAADTAWIADRHVVYFGRRGETRVERFLHRPLAPRWLPGA